MRNTTMDPIMAAPYGTQEIRLIIRQENGVLHTRIEGMPSDVHVRLAMPEPQVTMAERVALVAMDATVNALEGYGLKDK